MLFLLLSAAAASASDFDVRLSASIQQSAATALGVEADDVEVLSTGFGGKGCGDAIDITARPNEDYLGTTDLRVVASEGGVICGQWRVRSRLAVWMTLPVAAKAAAAGDPIELRAERVRVDRPLGTPVPMSGRPLAARTSVRSGQVVVAELARAIPDVGTGQPVILEVRAGSLTITSEGFLAQASTVGETVRVRTASTNTVIEGTLVAHDRVVVE